jgi:hypothetical protein
VNVAGEQESFSRELINYNSEFIGCSPKKIFENKVLRRIFAH